LCGLLRRHQNSLSEEVRDCVQTLGLWVPRNMRAYLNLNN
ncbi:hypothetical protein LEMLEM_LOCUS24614, partial [Lemmus lemmus]